MSLEPRSARTLVTALVVALAALVGVAMFLARPYSRAPVDDYIASVKAAGKPEPRLFDQARALIPRAERVAMVGDRIASDIEGGRQAGHDVGRPGLRDSREQG